jgi:hypothetical protein
MSYYGVYPDVYIDYMVCSTCSAEAFSWLAEIFSCTFCGGDDYEYPAIADTEAECTDAKPGHTHTEPSKLKSEEEVSVKLATEEQYKFENPGKVLVVMCGK